MEYEFIGSSSDDDAPALPTAELMPGVEVLESDSEDMSLEEAALFAQTPAQKARAVLAAAAEDRLHKRHPEEEHDISDGVDSTPMKKAKSATSGVEPAAPRKKDPWPRGTQISKMWTGEDSFDGVVLGHHSGDAAGTKFPMFRRVKFCDGTVYDVDMTCTSVTILPPEPAAPPERLGSATHSSSAGEPCAAQNHRRLWASLGRALPLRQSRTCQGC